MRALPTYDEATGLPAAPSRRVPAEYGDGNGHLNVRHYLGILDDAEWIVFDEFGAGNEASEAGIGGMFALEQFLTYRREVLVGDEVAVHLRLLEREPRMLHLVSYLVNHTRHEVFVRICDGVRLCPVKPGLSRAIAPLALLTTVTALVIALPVPGPGDPPQRATTATSRRPAHRPHQGRPAPVDGAAGGRCWHDGSA